ncbi:Transcriptional regulator containing an amidase domain and an AraC-type DNA-binding HTH domain [Paenibacillus sp. UNCCL117]|uniref:DJ-1/PfpI family protein n=1 Tax=unclassified Paenibacillus TaxID=185978 RepID=UPI00088DE976|nr:MULTISPECIES: DJ-1/PfpI family protein [unclassified Paenibacillus]SDD65725.1 DJ-1/PfpI family protein [Paenibacillus sp. cl123]SFW58065.1 Transcriptional regulator containing an amidase domain and an AraC-type DNA-binding HTH domain [Paenibacillus sp. UNCCL117]
MLNVQIVLFDGFDYMDVIGPYEVFKAAGMLSGAGMNVSFVSAEGSRTVPSGMNGPGLLADGKITLGKGGFLVVPGAMGTVGLGDSGPDAVITRLRQATDTALMPFLREAMTRNDVTVATVCGGTMLLAMDGLLENRYAVTHYLGMEALEATGARPVPARVVVDGRLVTGGGVTSGLDVALYLVERELGPQISHAVEKLFEYERRGTVWHASGMAPIAAQQAQAAPDEALSDASFPLPQASSPHAFDGIWDLAIATPLGQLSVEMTVATAANGKIRGTCRQGDEIADLIDPRIENGRMAWSLSIRKPMRLNLKFTATVQEEQLTGTAKAGMLPSSRVQGTRRKE